MVLASVAVERVRINCDFDELPFERFGKIGNFSSVMRTESVIFVEIFGGAIVIVECFPLYE